MIKTIFCRSSDRYGALKGSVNFVDDRNVLVGYELEQSCCEHAYWTCTLTGDEECPELELWHWRFDPEHPIEYLDDEEHWVARFRLVNEDEDKEAFLELHNCHNGYYSHGFWMEVDGERRKDGAL